MTNLPPENDEPTIPWAEPLLAIDAIHRRLAVLADLRDDDDRDLDANQREYEELLVRRREHANEEDRLRRRLRTLLDTTGLPR